MAKFHINGKGVPAPCNAKQGKCPLGGGEGEHFETEKAAQDYIDNKSAEEFGILGTTQSTKENSRHDKDRFDRLDRLVANMDVQQVVEEFSQTIDPDKMQEFNNHAIYEYDLDDMIDQDSEAYEQLISISNAIGSQTTLDELSQHISANDLHETIDDIEDNWGLSEEKNETKLIETLDDYEIVDKPRKLKEHSDEMLADKMDHIEEMKKISKDDPVSLEYLSKEADEINEEIMFRALEEEIDLDDDEFM